METFQKRIDELRNELIQSIVEILKSNNLREIELPDKDDYVVWFDNNGNAYDSPVNKVSLYEDGICLDVQDEDENISSTLYRYDLGCRHLDWLESIRVSILDVIHRNNVENNRNAIELTVQENGDLLITVVNREEFEAIVEREYQDERGYLAEMLDNSRYIGNDWHCPYEIGLTEAPAIGQGAVYPEDENCDDSPADYENLWYFGDYMIKSYIEILQNEGQIIFTAHRDNLSERPAKHD
jgi:hypothetical protein